MRRRIRHLCDYLTSIHEANWAALFFMVIGILAVGAGFDYLYSEFSLRQFVTDLYANGGAELMSIALTVFIIDGLNRRRAIQERKEELILQMGSSDNAFAIEAVRILRQKGWLMDGSLHNADLFRANLQRAKLQQANLQAADLGAANLQAADLLEANLQAANLWEANLQKAYLGEANLQKANLVGVNLQGANLEGANLQCASLEVAHLQAAHLERANLQGANLEGANLQAADLLEANLQAAHLERANLQGANLQEANLQAAHLKGANLQGATFAGWGETHFPTCDETTTLPDGSHWTPDRDWREFTHPDEWAAEQAAKKRFTFTKPPGFARPVSDNQSSSSE